MKTLRRSIILGSLLLVFTMVPVAAQQTDTGNMPDLERWVVQNLSFTTDYCKEGDEGNVSVSFVITKTGHIRDVKLVHSYSNYFADRVLNVLNEAPLQKTKMQNGRPVTSSHKLMFSFFLKKDPARDPSMLYADDGKIHYKADIMPTFMGGGPRQFKRWVRQQVALPDDVDTMNGGVRVIAWFVIGKDGSISGLTVDKTSESLSREVKRVLEKAPAWIPAVSDGENVRFKCIMGIDFGKVQADGASNSDEDTFQLIETMPSFQGGDLETFRRWIGTQVVYPEKALNEEIEGRVIVAFVIERDGTVSTIEVTQFPDVLLASEVVRVVGTSPKWTPGTVGGVAVRVKYSLPVDFRLQKVADLPSRKTMRPSSMPNRPNTTGR